MHIICTEYLVWNEYMILHMSKYSSSQWAFMFTFHVDYNKIAQFEAFPVFMVIWKFQHFFARHLIYFMLQFLPSTDQIK